MSKALSKIDNGDRNIEVLDPLPATWPVTTSSRAPDGRAAENIIWYCATNGIYARLNEFDLQTYVRLDGKTQRLDDVVIRDITMRLNTSQCFAKKELVADVLLDAGAKKSFHPVRDFLDRLKWDKVPRLDTMLIRLAGAEDTALNRAISAAWMISAVRRVRSPGIKADAMLVLVGEQGLGKSSLFQVLAGPEWFTDDLEIGVDSKLVIEKATGVWIAECAELSGMVKREIEQVKAFITRQKDTARLAYARVTSQVPRQFVLCGTVNRQQFLLDDTGNRRFWPVVVSNIDLQTLSLETKQLWAEAAYREKKGESHNIPSELWDAAAAVAADHTIADTFFDAIEVLLPVPGPDDFMISNEDLYGAMGYSDFAKRGGPVGRSVSNAMAKLGWVQDREYIDGHRQRVWKREGTAVANRKSFVLKSRQGGPLRQVPREGAV